MSWMKRRSQNNTPSPAPVGQLTEPVPMYNPNQANQWQSNNWYQQKQQAPVQQQNYWEQQQGYADQQNQQIQNQNTQHFQQYPDQPTTHGNSVSQTFHNPQSYGNLQYNQQYNTQNNSFQEVTLQNNESDSWGNWGWGDEDNSNIQAVHSGQEQNTGTRTNETAAFGSDETWNWSVDESANQEKDQQFREDPGIKMVKPATSIADQFQLEKPGDSPISAISSTKRSKLETPQWSVDSQVSQESSDDILQTSESDNHLVSSSTLSHSPLSGLDSLQPMKEDILPEKTSFVYQHIENSESLSENPSQSSSYNLQSHPGTSVPQDNPYNKTSGLSQRNFPTFVQNTYAESVNQSVNLETLPDNSEHPDVPVNPSGISFDSMNLTNKVSHVQNFQDNKEVPPINDRNQYLQTGQLSDANQLNFLAGTEANSMKSNHEDALPPPGLRRMVLGQIGQQETSATPENSNDEPPPGLSRMVLGQNETNLPTSSNPVNEDEIGNVFEPISPPEGLRRMVPGESSSPENSLGQTTFQTENTNIDDSDHEFNRMPQHRSATIGADMPPAPVPPIAPSPMSSSNRSETIGAADTSERSGGSGIPPPNTRKTLRKSKEKKIDSQRRDFIEGQQVESEINSVVAGVRNLSVGDNLANESDEINMKSEARRKLSRQDTSESENENRSKSSRDRKDRRYRGDRKEREYSPDPSREKRYDRRKYRDRHYEENADYLSDGERDRNNRDKDYDKRTYSLRRDKERDRRRKESPREYDRDSRRKREDYYHRYDDSYDNEERSRPSSRTDSMHDSMYRGERRPEKESKDRRREKPRDREKHRRPRDSYNPYMQGYGGYDPYNPYYQQYQYQYYENLRRTNPQAYAEIYRKYYEQHARLPPNYGPDDRSSVHSGRSSANEELTADRYTRQSYYSQSSMQYLGGYYPRDSKTNSISGHYDLDESSMFKSKTQTDAYNLDDSSSKLGRETPPKFVTAHTWSSIRSGRLVNILPNYPQDGQPALVELAPLETYLQKDNEFKELANYPGPLTKDVTHKKTVIEYCENKIKNVSANLDISDPESYVLMWELLILLLRQNGKVVGTDIAELLLKKRTDVVPARPASVLSNLSSNIDHVPSHSDSSNAQVTDETTENSTSVLKEEEVTNKFREYLLYGSEQEALEWAMKQGLWGHALFLASKLGKRTYSNVMVRFANGLTLNDPLQTLYQLLSGKMPAAVSGVADEKWGDWKPHLSMILSNSSLQPDLNRKAITSLGDTLMARGSLYAAQFCYLMAEVGFERYGRENAKIVLLGSNHQKPFSHFATNEAIHMTEIYEYACSLNDPEFAIPELQAYKYLMATRLGDHGFLEKALAYLEKIALYIIINPSNVQSSLIHNVYNMADRLKYYDPIGFVEDDENYDENADNRLDNSWLKNLRLLQESVNSGLISTLDSKTNVTFTDPNETTLYGHNLDETLQGTWDQSQMYDPQQAVDNSQVQWQHEQHSQIETSLDPYQQRGQQIEGYPLPSYQNQQPKYWSNQQPQQWESNGNDATDSPENETQNYYGSITQNEEEGKPQISIPNQSRGKSIFDDEPLPHEKTQKEKEPPSKMDVSKKQQQNSSGWFGGIFSKLALRPKNQMKLPDDKNPSIVWDQEKKRWVNLDEDNNKADNNLKPPPKISDMKSVTPKSTMGPIANNNPMPQPQLYSNTIPPNNSTIPSMTKGPEISQQQFSIGQNQDNSLQGNMFKLQKSRNLKKSYIDVFNPAGNVKLSAPSPNLNSLPTQDMIPQMNLFVPQPVNDPNAPMNFLTQGNVTIQPQREELAQLSRWSSASSLSKEVQHYMQHKTPYTAS